MLILLAWKQSSLYEEMTNTKVVLIKTEMPQFGPCHHFSAHTALGSSLCAVEAHVEAAESLRG